MKRNTLFTIMITAMLLASGCSTAVIEGSGNKLVASEPVTLHGSMYGFDWQGKKNVILAKDMNNRPQAIYRVQSHTNYLYLLTGVVSLGFYYPQTFEYTLIEPVIIDDEEEESYKPKKKNK
ncbi:MAG: hypothetical protein HRT88_09115 [Lentisphaeraceae bacterium]|nr:hypothetical protein [Lentisphaeraceae bacterium]